MHGHGLKPNLRLGLLTMDDIRTWVLEALAAKNPPTAVFSLNHRTSVYLLEVLAEQKIRVPEELAIIGFDDFDLAGVVSPPLTTVAQFPVELARRSMALLMTGIHEAKSGLVNSPAKVMLPTRLIIRSSCGPHGVPEP